MNIMARTVGRLTTLKVERAKRGEEPPGMYPDGGGLYLQVTKARRKGESEAEYSARPPSAASWLLRYQLAGRSHYMGLGPVALYGLAEARALALDAKRLRHQGIDPIASRRHQRARLRLEAAKAITFKAATETYITAHAAGWADKTKAGWKATLATYAEPVIGDQPLQAIDTALVLKVLEPIWTKKPEIAGRVRQRIEALLDWAKARGYREGENPARWDGHLDNLLPARAKVRKVKHHAALPYPETCDFMRALRAHQGAAADALEFTILCAARTGEVIGARPGEIDLAAKIP